MLRNRHHSEVTPSVTVHVEGDGRPIVEIEFTLAEARDHWERLGRIIAEAERESPDPPGCGREVRQACPIGADVE
jgi:hypothetical protein